MDTNYPGVNALVIRLLTNCSTGRAISALVEHMDSLLNETGRSRSPKVGSSSFLCSQGPVNERQTQWMIFDSIAYLSFIHIYSHRVNFVWTV